ncbi:hypothetical protein ABIB24_004697 [Pseudomonas sp. UYEF17]
MYWCDPCGSGFTREADAAVDGTGYAGVRGHARSHTDRAGLKVFDLGHCLYRHGASPGALRDPCGSGHAREAGAAVDGTGYAGVRG